MATQQAENRGRIPLAVGAGAAMAAVIAVVAVASGGGDAAKPTQPAPPTCIDAWNADPAARAYGRHNFSFHRYEGALVTFLDQSAQEPGRDDLGLCAVVFPSRALDPEPFAAGQMLRRRRWVPISSLPGVDLARVADLQLTAADAPNTRLDVRGELTAQ